MRAPHVRGVRHHRRVHAVEDAGRHEPALADPQLLGRTADHDQAQGVFRQRAGERAGGQQARRPGEVVPAGVADLGQRVHLGQQRRAPGRRAAPRHEGGLQPRHRLLDREAARARDRLE